MPFFMHLAFSLLKRLCILNCNNKGSFVVTNNDVHLVELQILNNFNKQYFIFKLWQRKTYIEQWEVLLMQLQ